MILQMEYAVFLGFGNILLPWQRTIFKVFNAKSDRLFGVVFSTPDAVQDVPGPIPDYNPEIFYEVYGLKWDLPSLVRTTE